MHLNQSSPYCELLKYFITDLLQIIYLLFFCQPLGHALRKNMKCWTLNQKKVLKQSTTWLPNRENWLLITYSMAMLSYQMHTHRLTNCSHHRWTARTMEKEYFSLAWCGSGRKHNCCGPSKTSTEHLPWVDCPADNVQVPSSAYISCRVHLCLKR